MNLLKRQSVDEALKEDTTSLWVVNNTTKTLGHEGSGHIIIELKVDGSPYIARLPKSKEIPFDLSTEAPKTALLGHPKFKKLVMEEHVYIVTNDSALAVMQNPDIKKESLRLYSKLSSDGLTQVGEKRVSAAEVEDSIRPFVLNLANTTSLNDSEVISMIRNDDLIWMMLI